VAGKGGKGELNSCCSKLLTMFCANPNKEWVISGVRESAALARSDELVTFLDCSGLIGLDVLDGLIWVPTV